jgi:hypothetical protein
MKLARLLAAASCAVPAMLGSATASSQEHDYPSWVAAAQEAAGACVQKMFAGDDCRSDGWQFSKWDLNIVTIRPARATITVIQGISEERPRKGMTYIVERTGRGDRPMIHGFPGAPEYLAVANIAGNTQASVLLVTREHVDRQAPDVIRLYRKTGGHAEAIASNDASRTQAGNIHLTEGPAHGAKSFFALVGDALYLCRGRQTEHACARFRDLDADVYRAMHDGG